MYCIDTSSLISAWYDRYKPNRFPKLWEQFESLVIMERLVSSSLVLNECKVRSPELHGWLVEHEAMFLQPDADVQARAAYIINTYKGLVMQGKEKFAADPFVIATAEVYGYRVVSEEDGPANLKKIPGVCSALQIPCFKLADLFDAEDWTLG
ncbi:DUF4411 family protein [Methylobacterium sp. M6A4_1b]